MNGIPQSADQTKQRAPKALGVRAQVAGLEIVHSRAEHAKKAHFTRMALKSAQARREKAELRLQKGTAKGKGKGKAETGTPTARLEA